MARSESTATKQARTVLAGTAIAPQELLKLVNQLKAERSFGFARKLLDRYAGDDRVRADHKLRIKVAQQRALSTYKDPDLPADEKLDRALGILAESDDLTKTRNPETLGLAGAIYKRKWELTGRERELELSLACYYRGYTEADGEDYGYTGINAAFVLDVIADIETAPGRRSSRDLDTSGQRREEARRIRQTLVERLPTMLNLPGNDWLKNEWWFYATIGEAFFGLGDYTQALAWLSKGRMLPEIPDWELESTARQLAALLLLKRKAGAADEAAAFQTLRDFLGNDNAVGSVVRGKIGLALSGGGFRASLYHIGVLAKLAELDLLRSVEYLSCVSGGSIIGAHYYLEVRKLLQDKADDTITREDYIDIVKRIEVEFLEGVQRNIRTRILAEWLTDLKMIVLPDYSRTMRAGELYETELYARIPDGEGGSPRWLNRSTVAPRGEKAGFAPKDHNWRRANKVPILILNATALNTGHNWQFTATWMGEPPGTLDTAVDANYRLRRLYYSDAPPGNREVRLGYAVAASACVPGIFEPLSLTKIYRRRAEGRDIDPIVRLVDGGVHDNQGVAALLDQGCNVLLVSDASGQMSADDFPSQGVLAVPLRSNSILQARVREAEYRELCARQRAGPLKGLMFIHLKQGLEIDPVDWIDCHDPSERQPALPLTDYGVQRKVQSKIAAIRTDLDSFSHAEAYALMCSGYLMTEHALGHQGSAPEVSALGFQVRPASREEWRFLHVANLMGLPDEPGQPNPLLRQLQAADKRFFKVWSLSPVLKWLGTVIGLVLIALVAFLAYEFWKEQLFALTVGEIVAIIGALALSLLGLGWLSKAINYRKTLDDLLIGIGLVFVGSFLARLHLHVFDRIFLRQGDITRWRH